jgi:hypothetical protein
MSKDAQLSDVSGNSMVLVISQCNLLEPCTDLGRAIVLPALKLSLDGFKLRDHSLFRRDPPDGKGSGFLALPTVVGEAQEREGFWFSLSPLLSVSGGEPPELNQSCLVRM